MIAPTPTHRDLGCRTLGRNARASR